MADSHDDQTETFSRRFVKMLAESDNEISLRQHLEYKITCLKNEVELKFKNVNDRADMTEAALELQSGANRDHFETLNHEAARILKATEITVSRDTWDAFQKDYSDWKSRIERTMAAALGKDEFNTYRTETNRALTLRTGQGQGVYMSWQTFLAIFGLIGLALTAWGAFKSPSQPTTVPLQYAVPMSPGVPFPVAPASR